MKKIILSLVFLIVLITLGTLSWAEEIKFTPIFCNDYEFTCCSEELISTNSHSITDESSWSCPSTAYRCEIVSSSTNDYDYIVGSQNCRIETGFLQGHWWECDDENINIKNLNPNSQVYLRQKGLQWGDVTATVEIKIFKTRLDFCGRAGCTQGIPVSGADGCKFNPTNGLVYTTTNSLSGKVDAASYTVPMSKCVLAFQTGDRHICGYKEESCYSDNDCSGHTYGNKECNGRKIQTYGCMDYGSEVNEENRGPFDSGWGTDKQKPLQSGDADFGKRCEIINAEEVQCCGDTDCGTDYFCDKSTFTCKENAECKKDYDCGVSTQCDSYTNTLKKPVCKDEKCVFEEIKVECCSNENCGVEGYCDQYKCKGSTPLQSAEVKETLPGTGGAVGVPNKRSSSTGIIILVFFLILIGGSIVFYIFYRKSQNKTVPKQEKTLPTQTCSRCGTALHGKFCTKCGGKA